MYHLYKYMKQIIVIGYRVPDSWNSRITPVDRLTEPIFLTGDCRTYSCISVHSLD